MDTGQPSQTHSMQTNETSRSMVRPVFRAGIVEGQLPLDELRGEVASHTDAGGVVVFFGNVRAYNLGREVSHLEYECHRVLAEKSMLSILQDVASAHPLKFAGVFHRIGRVMPGESAVLVITACPHRAESYAANQLVMQRVKHEAPIWKKECYVDGTHAWGHNCDH